MKLRIIDATIKDDSDYDYLHDQAIHNTLRKYFKWAEESNADINFTKSYGEESYSLSLYVDAVFKNIEDYAQFKLSFDKHPYTQLKMTPNMEGYFDNE
jgi:hypothetical protein|tara:strand:+ start:59 stop:352 length:294 start_codon:yes stop_codon:yes gene_type:complete